MSRSANFKIETLKDVEQDQDIDTLTTTLNNLVIPDQSTISPNVINLGGEGGVKLEAQGSQFTVFGSAYYTGEIISNEAIATPIVYTNLALLGTNNNYITSTLAIDGAQNVIRSERNASITGINEITCAKLNYTELNPPINIPAEPLKQLLTYYVDASIGSDSVNDGSREKPYKTIQKSIDICELVYDGTARQIIVSFGSYAENLTITKPRIQITGSCPTRYVNVACNITGTINVQISGSTDLFNSQVMIHNFQIVGKIIDTSSSVHTLNIKDCYLYGTDNMVVQSTKGDLIPPLVLNDPPTYVVVDSRTYIEGCTIQSNTSSGSKGLVEINSGGLAMTSCQLTTSGTNSCLTLNSTAQLYNMALNTFTNDNVSNQLQPLILITTPTGTHTFGNCGFIFSKSSATARSTSSTPYNTAIFVSGRYARLVLLYNYFALTSTSVSDHIVKSSYAENLVLHSYNSTASCALNPCAYLIGGVGTKIAFSNVA